MSQIWIESNGNYMMARFCKSNQLSDLGILLAPGLFEPDCDLYYFNQEFFEELRNNSYCGLTFDYAGHGDSYLNISDCSISLLECNLRDSLDFLRNQGVTKIIAVGRGIGGNLLKSIVDEHDVKSIYMINPLIFDCILVNVLDNFIEAWPYSEVKLSKNVLIELQKILYMAGVDMSNIEDECISKDFLKELQDNYQCLFSKECLSNDKYKVIITNDVREKYPFEVNEYFCGEDFSSYNGRLKIINGILSDVNAIRF